MYFLRIRNFLYVTTAQLSNFRKFNIDKILLSDLSTFLVCPIMSFIASCPLLHGTQSGYTYSFDMYCPIALYRHCLSLHFCQQYPSPCFPTFSPASSVIDWKLPEFKQSFARTTFASVRRNMGSFGTQVSAVAPWLEGFQLTSQAEVPSLLRRCSWQSWAAHFVFLADLALSED